MRKTLHYFLLLAIVLFAFSAVQARQPSPPDLKPAFSAIKGTAEVSPTTLYFDYESESTKPVITYLSASLTTGTKANPLKEPLNESDSVGWITTSSLTYEGFKISFARPLDLVKDTAFTMMVYHPTLSSTKVRIQIQGPGLNSNTEGKLDQPYTTPGHWQKLTWVIPANYRTKEVTAILICVNSGTGTAGQEWYFDNLFGPDKLPVLGKISYFDFETDDSKPVITYISSNIQYLGTLANPEKSGYNTSDSVGAVTTSSATYDGFKISFDGKLNLNNGDTTFSMKVYHPTLSSSKVRIQIQGPGLNVASDGKIDVKYTTPGQWQILTWSIPAKWQNQEITAILLCINSGTGTAGEQWYFDELRGPDVMPLLELGAHLYFDFEGAADTDPVFTETSAKFLGVVANPLKDAMNSSDSVGLSQTSGSADWDGIVYKFDQPIDLSEDSIFTMLVYHPDSTGSTRLQFDGDGMSSLKMNVQYDTPGQWELLTWRVDKKYDDMITKITIVFDHNNGQAGGADAADVEEWYFDELRGPVENAPPAYEPAKTYYNATTYRKNWIGYQGSEYKGAVDNPKIDTNNDSEYAGESLTGTDTWSGMYYDLPAKIDFTDDQVFMMWVYSDSTGYVRIQLENPGGVSTKPKLSVLYDTPGEWKQLTFSAADNVGDPMVSDTYNRIVLVFDDKDADAGEAWYFDKLLGPKIGDVTPTYTYFDFDSISATFGYFQGAIFGGVVENPVMDAVNESDSVGTFFTGTDTWSGMYTDLPSTVNFNEGTSFSVDILSDSTGRVRVGLEKRGVSDVSKRVYYTAYYETPGQWAHFDLTLANSDYANAFIQNDYFNRVTFTFDDLEKDIGELWYFDNLKGPMLTPVYYQDAIFTVTQVNSNYSAYKIQIDNAGDMIDLYNDGTHGDTLASDNIWTVSVAGILVGDHVYDVYGDGAIVANGDDVTFSVPEFSMANINFDDVVGIFNHKSNDGLSVYPNPVNNVLNIQSERNISTAKIYTITGAEILSINAIGSKMYNLNTTNLLPGFYLISVTDESGNTMARRFIKQ